MWTDGRLIGFDVETTGVDPREARIVTAAVAEVGGGERTIASKWLADPGIDIPDEAAAIHGITTDRARADGQPAGDVIAEVVARIEGRPSGAPVVAFNARYDLTVLTFECRRHGVEFDPAGLLVIDPIVIDKHIDRYRKGSRRLAVTCEHYGAALEGAHDAAADALAACRVAWVIGQRGRIIRKVRNGREANELAVLMREWEQVRSDLRLLHEAQRRWAGEQARSLAEYMVENGNFEDAVKVESEWPVLPVREEAMA